MDYLPNPIDVEAFNRRLRAIRNLDETFVLVGFRQTAYHWTATYQDEELSCEFRGRVAEWHKIAGGAHGNPCAQG